MAIHAVVGANWPNSRSIHITKLFQSWCIFQTQCIVVKHSLLNIPFVWDFFY